MGVRGLMAWVRKAHPEVVQSRSQRWASPDVRGKRVAIDATLLTNRFHFGNKDTSQRATSALLGWYGMIKDMRSNGVEAVAVWDERGERLWKAPEARKRLESRATLLARRMHEDRRAERLARLQDELEVHLHMSEVEKGIVAEAWRSGLAPIPMQHGKTSGSPMDYLVTVVYVARLATHIHILDELWTEHKLDYREHLTTFGDYEDKTIDVFEEEVQMLSTSGSADGSVDGMSSSMTGESVRLQIPRPTQAVDARSKALPAPIYTETARQRALSDMEAEVWEVLGLQTYHADDLDTMYHPPRLLTIDEVESFAAEADGLPDIDALTLKEMPGHPMFQDVPGAMAILDEIISLSPSVRDTYIRALDMPLEEHHAACRSLLTAMGVPILTATVPYEAEGLASALALAGEVEFIGTEDSDALVYGGTMIKNLSTPTAPLLLVDSEALRSRLPFTADEYRDFCILLGTDASPRIPGVGPARAFALMREYGSIEAILEGRRDLARTVDEGFMEMIRNARRLFTHLPPTSKWARMGEDAGREWLKERGIDVDDAGKSKWKKAAKFVKREDERDAFLDAWTDEVVDSGDWVRRALPTPPRRDDVWPE